MSKYITQMGRFASLMLAAALTFGLISTQQSDTARAVTRTQVAAAAPAASVSAAATPKRLRAYNWAHAKIGIPYCYGGAGHGENGCPKGRYDCSGLVMRAYQSVGIHLARTTGGMLQDRGNKIFRSNHPKKGYLVFTSSGHVGLYVSKGKFLSSPRTGSKVRISNIYSGAKGYPRYYGVYKAG